MKDTNNELRQLSEDDEKYPNIVYAVINVFNDRYAAVADANNNIQMIGGKISNRRGILIKDNNLRPIGTQGKYAIMDIAREMGYDIQVKDIIASKVVDGLSVVWYSASGHKNKDVVMGDAFKVKYIPIDVTKSQLSFISNEHNFINDLDI